MQPALRKQAEQLRYLLSLLVGRGLVHQALQEEVPTDAA